MKQIIFFTLLLYASCNSLRAETIDSLTAFSPKVEGTIRTKYEYNTNLMGHRFQIRNSRFSILGNFSPIVSYKAEIDLSDEGVTKMLDSYIRIKTHRQVSFTVGQQKIPFSTDNLRSPHQLFFANRSFIGKQLTSLRDVGATFIISNKHKLPYDLTLGLYNGDGLYNQQNWKSDNLSFAARLELFPIKNLEISLNYNSIKPEQIRMYLYNFGSFCNFGNFHIETEFYLKTYQHNVFKATKGYFVFGAYDVKINKPNVTKISPVLRYDLMTDNNRGYISEDGTYTVDHFARSRFTGGVTISLNKPFLNDIRLNYEKYIYRNGITDIEDKIVAEVVVKF